MALNPLDHGRLRFQFCDGYSIDVQVFVSLSYQGEPIETEEAIPLWYPLDDIPYDEMWEDDQLWLQRVLSGETVDGRFIFDGDRNGNLLRREFVARTRGNRVSLEISDTF